MSGIYFEPVNINQWNMFEKVAGAGHVEPFLATNSMKIGDLVLLHVGSQSANYESGIYAYGTVISEPYILENSPSDYCNNKNTVDVRIDYISYSNPIITHSEAKEFINQFRTVHRIDDMHYERINQTISCFTDADGSTLTAEEKEAAEILLSNIAKGTYHITYKELSDKMSTHPNPHIGLIKILDHIGMKCGELGLPFITLMVVSQNSKEPGDGAYVFYKRFNIDTRGKTNNELFSWEMSKIRKCPNWQLLADDLELDIIMLARGEVVYPYDIKDKVYLCCKESSCKRIRKRCFS